eukprot:GDKI01008998.1.p1 GENE.GDKI01008998.1~~GDKI01008998.1.p1  ORF type:complete len:782 (-),score=173.77 GDKI01008998.1:38-2260(-)
MDQNHAEWKQHPFVCTSNSHTGSVSSDPSPSPPCFTPPSISALLHEYSVEVMRKHAADSKITREVMSFNEFSALLQNIERNNAAEEGQTVADVMCVSSSGSGRSVSREARARMSVIDQKKRTWCYRETVEYVGPPLPAGVYEPMACVHMRGLPTPQQCIELLKEMETETASPDMKPQSETETVPAEYLPTFGRHQKVATRKLLHLMEKIYAHALPKWVEKNAIEHSNIYMGVWDSGGVCFDTHDRVLHVLYGRQSVHVYGAQETVNLYPKGRSVLPIQSCMHSTSAYHRACTHHPHIIRERLPRLAQARCTVYDIGAGETLFVPAGFWYEVITPVVTISVEELLPATHPRVRFRPSLMFLNSETYWSFLLKRNAVSADYATTSLPELIEQETRVSQETETGIGAEAAHLRKKLKLDRSPVDRFIDEHLDAVKFRFWSDASSDPVPIPDDFSGSRNGPAHVPWFTHFSAIFCINLKHRTDRRQEFSEEMGKFGVGLCANLLQRSPVLDGASAHCCHAHTGSIARDGPSASVFHVEAVHLSEQPALGCALSHIAVLQFASSMFEQKAETAIIHERCVMVLEDDIQFTIDQVKLNRFFSQIFVQQRTEFDVLQLSASIYDLQIDSPVQSTHRQADITCARVRSAQTTVGYVVHQNFIPRLLQNFRESAEQLARHSIFRCTHETETGKHVMGGEETWAIDQHWKQLQKQDDVRWYLCTPLVAAQRAGHSDITGRFEAYAHPHVS